MLQTQEQDTRILLFRAKLLIEEGQIDEALSGLEAIHAEKEQDQRELAYLHGWCHIQKQSWDEATAVLSSLARYSGDEVGQDTALVRERLALALLHLGNAAVNVSHYEDASKHLTACLKMLQDKRIHQPLIRIRARYALAMTYTMRGLYPAAIQHYEEALKLFAKVEDDVEQANVYHGLCYTYLRWGKLIDAHVAGSAALRLYEKGRNNQENEGRMHNLLGTICQQLRDYTEAADHYLEALMIATTYDSLSMVILNCTSLAELRLAEDRLEEAKRYCQRAQDVTDRLQIAYVRGLASLVTGKVTQAEAHLYEGEKRQNLLEEAMSWFEKAIYQLSLTQAYADVAETYGRWAQVLEELGHLREANRCWKSAYQALSSPKGMAWD